MSEVIKANFAKGGLSAADRRAIAFHDWIASHEAGVSTDEMKAELERLTKMVPDDEAKP